MIIQFIVSLFATLSFAELFGAPKKELFFCGLTGAIGWVSTFRRKRDRPVKRWAIPFLIGRLCFMQRRNSASMTTRSVTATHTII